MNSRLDFLEDLAGEAEDVDAAVDRDPDQHLAESSPW
jgi:hypothetical protein